VLIRFGVKYSAIHNFVPNVENQSSNELSHNGTGYFLHSVIKKNEPHLFLVTIAYAFEYFKITVTSKSVSLYSL